MADFREILLDPSCDLHLTISPGLPRVRLTVTARRRLPETDTGPFRIEDVTDRCEFDVFPDAAPLFLVEPDGEVVLQNPPFPGTGFIQVRLVDQDLVHSLVARVQVHERMNSWWFGNDHLTVPVAGGPGYTQVSLYALFDQGTPRETVGDITGHGYVPLQATQTRLFIEPGGRDRLKGLEVGPAGLAGQIPGVAGALGQRLTLDVSIVDLFDTPKPILERVRHKGPASEKTNLLFLGEGFRQQDRKRFDKVVEKVTSDLFSKGRHSPFKHLKKSFNVWKAFTPSRDRGITVGPEVNATDFAPILPDEDVRSAVAGNPPPFTLFVLTRAVGLPTQADSQRTMQQLQTQWQNRGLAGYNNARVAPDIVAKWQEQRPIGLLQAHDSFFGLCYGHRPGDRLSRSEPVANMVVPTSQPPGAFQFRVFSWFALSRAGRVPFPDPRRHERDWIVADGETRRGLSNVMLRFLATLRDPKVAATDPVNHDVGQYWQLGAKDQGLVVVLVNDVRFGAANFDAFTFLTVSISEADNYLGIEPVQDPARRILRRSREPVFREETTTDLVAHELGHSFNLGDEYEGRRGQTPNTLSLQALRDACEELVLEAGHDPGSFPIGSERFDNLTHACAVFSEAGPFGANSRVPIDPLSIKWDLPRIKQADAIVRPTQQVGGRVRLTLGPKRAKRWRKPMAKGTRVSLRRFKGRRQLPLSPFNEVLTGLEIFEIPDDGSETIVVGGLELPDPIPVFPAGSVLYIPRTDKQGRVVGLIKQPVLDRMDANPRAPLSENHPGCQPVAGDRPDHPPPGIPDLSYPKHDYKLIGLYEGGGTYACSVYRPAGSCKMRTEFGFQDIEVEPQFCFVCKYLIVNRIDPSKHKILDECEYP